MWVAVGPPASRVADVAAAMVASVIVLVHGGPAAWAAVASVVAMVTLACAAPRLQRLPVARDVLIVGTGALGRITGNEMLQGSGPPRVIGHLRFPDEGPNRRLHAPVLGTVDALESILRDRPVDEVYLASVEVAHRPSVQAAIRTCECLGLPFALPSCGFRLARARPVHEEAFADGYIHYCSVPVKPVQSAFKRLLDIVASGVALVLLSPLLAGVAFAVKATSPGPVLFRQERVGLRGHRFAMLKFRSMVADAEGLRARLIAQNEQSGPVFKIRSDPRITPLGRFIRKYSIDELPQLFNVLLGDMSIVGPRPPLPSEVARYAAWQVRRLSVRPGLTCVWQVSGRNQIPFEEWMMLDLGYVDHWNLAADLALIARTVPVVITGRGAS